MMDVDNTLPHSFTYSDDSDDAINSSSAKVYFGPILSPEKKLVSKFSRLRNEDIESQRVPDFRPIPPHPLLEKTSRDSGSSFQDAVVCGPSTPKFSNHASHLLVEDGLPLYTLLFKYF